MVLELLPAEPQLLDVLEALLEGDQLVEVGHVEVEVELPLLDLLALLEDVVHAGLHVRQVPSHLLDVLGLVIVHGQLQTLRQLLDLAVELGDHLFQPLLALAQVLVVVGLGLVDLPSETH